MLSPRANPNHFQKRQIALIARVTPYAMAGHLANTTVVAIALAGSVPAAPLTIWCAYSYATALFLLYRNLKNLGRSTRSLERASKRATIYAFLMALPWSGLGVLYLGSLPHAAELIVVALGIGMATCGTVLLSAIPRAAFSYLSLILLPSALKCLLVDQKGYFLLGTLALSYWGCLAALIAKTGRDIKERQESEQALAEREAQLGLAGKAARVGSFTVDYALGRVQVSPGHAAIHGLAEGTEEWSREEWRSRMHPDDLARLDALRSRVFAERRRELNTEYRIVGADGKAMWIESRGLVSYAGDGRPTRLVGVHIDITERKRAEDRLQESEHKLRDLLGALPAAST